MVFVVKEDGTRGAVRRIVIHIQEIVMRESGPVLACRIIKMDFAKQYRTVHLGFEAGGSLGLTGLASSGPCPLTKEKIEIFPLVGSRLLGMRRREREQQNR